VKQQFGSQLLQILIELQAENLSFTSSEQMLQALHFLIETSPDSIFLSAENWKSSVAHLQLPSPIERWLFNRIEIEAEMQYVLNHNNNADNASSGDASYIFNLNMSNYELQFVTQAAEAMEIQAYEAEVSMSLRADLVTVDTYEQELTQLTQLGSHTHHPGFSPENSILYNGSHPPSATPAAAVHGKATTPTTFKTPSAEHFLFVPPTQSLNFDLDEELSVQFVSEMSVRDGEQLHVEPSQFHPDHSSVASISPQTRFSSV